MNHMSPGGGAGGAGGGGGRDDDLALKYQRLATEYSKIKAQNQVLKKAVVEEQAKESAYKLQVREREQKVRTSEQEIESLTFRNQQLTARVTVLQNELDAVAAGDGKGRRAKVVERRDGIEHSVLGKELEGKIEENEKLHKRIHELESEYEVKIRQLEETLSEAEERVRSSEKKLSQTSEEDRNTIDYLHESKALLEVRLHKHEATARECRVKADQWEKKLNQVQAELGGKLECAQNKLLAKVPFDDEESDELNVLNCPKYNATEAGVVEDLVRAGDGLVDDLVSGLISFYTSLDARASVYPSTDNVEVEVGHETTSSLQPLLKTVTCTLQTVRKSISNLLAEAENSGWMYFKAINHIGHFCASFHEFATAAMNSLPQLLHQLELESSLAFCPAALQEQNSKLHQPMSAVTQIFTRLDSVLQLLCPKIPVGKSSEVDYKSVVEDVASLVMKLQEALKDLCKHLNLKRKLELEMPTIPAEVRGVSDESISSVISAATACGKLTHFLFTSSHVISDRLEVEGGFNQLAGQYHERSRQYLSCLQESPSASVPYLVSVEMMRSVQDKEQSVESLAQQLASFKDKVARLEQEKEHWKLELQLLQMKVKGSSGRSDSSRGSMSSQPVSYSMLGQVESSMPDDGGDEEVGREVLMREYFMKRFSELNRQLHLMDAKACAFYQECEALNKHLRLCENSKLSTEAELSDALQVVNSLRDELQTTRNSYEDQLTTMSEHLANMNEKLAAQKDEIDSLTHHMHVGSKDQKKKRGK